MLDGARGIDRDRFSVVAGALLLTLALSRLLDTPARPLLRLIVFGTPLGVNLSARLILGLIMVGLVISGMAVLLRSHPLAQTGLLAYPFMSAIAPSLMGIALINWLDRLSGGQAIIAGLLVSAGLLPAVLLMEYWCVDREVRRQALWPWGQQALLYLTAVTLFTLIISTRTRSLISGTAVVVTAFLLALRLLWIYQERLARLVLYAAGIGLILGQATWLLNALALSSLRGGLLLLTLFYCVVGMVEASARESAEGQNVRRVLLEYGIVAVLAGLLIVAAVP